MVYKKEGNKLGTLFYRDELNNILIRYLTMPVNVPSTHPFDIACILYMSKLRNRGDRTIFKATALHASKFGSIPQHCI